jgi:hypothetical protein
VFAPLRNLVVRLGPAWTIRPVLRWIMVGEAR